MKKLKSFQNVVIKYSSVWKKLQLVSDTGSTSTLDSGMSSAAAWKETGHVDTFPAALQWELTGCCDFKQADILNSDVSKLIITSQDNMVAENPL